MVRDDVRLRFISLSKQALGVGAASGPVELPLAQAVRLAAFVARSPSRIEQAIEFRSHASDGVSGAWLEGRSPFEQDDHDENDDC